MKSPYVSDLQPNQQLQGVFLVQAKEVRQKKSGEPYLSLLLSDKTGDLEAKMWDNVAEIADSFERDDFVKVKGLTQVYQNRLQLTIHKLARVDEREVDFADYFPASSRNPDEMLAELKAAVAGMQDADLRGLLEAILNDPEIARRYKTAPAAKSIHHAWLGGLIEHVLSLCALAKFAASHYEGIDLDLLLSGVILHDIGKIEELSYDRGFSYSDDGQLLGHIMIGIRIIHDKLSGLPQFPRKKRVLLEHMVLSHHGQLEYGSPKLPLFPEALLLHYLDNLDSKMLCIKSLAERDRQVEGNWTGFSAPLERVILKKDRYLSEKEDQVKPAATAPPSAASKNQERPAALQNTLFSEKLQQALVKD